MSEDSPTVRAVRYLVKDSPLLPIMEDRDRDGRWIINYCFVGEKDCPDMALRNFKVNTRELEQVRNVKPFSETQRALTLIALSTIESKANVKFRQVSDPAKANIRFARADFCQHVPRITLGQVDDNWPGKHCDIILSNDNHKLRDVALHKKWYGTLLHEIGHATGLKHPYSDRGVEYVNGEKGSIMSILPGRGPEDKRNDIGEADVMAWQYIYGAPPPIDGDLSGLPKINKRLEKINR